MSKWKPISSAPKDGDEVLLYREDAGVFLGRWTSPENFLTDREMERSEMTEDSFTAFGWFYADFIQGGRLDDDMHPTHWMPLPDAPLKVFAFRGAETDWVAAHDVAEARKVLISHYGISHEDIDGSYESIDEVPPETVQMIDDDHDYEAAPDEQELPTAADAIAGKSKPFLIGSTAV